MEEKQLNAEKATRLYKVWLPVIVILVCLIPIPLSLGVSEALAISIVLVVLCIVIYVIAHLALIHPLADRVVLQNEVLQITKRDHQINIPLSDIKTVEFLKVLNPNRIEITFGDGERLTFLPPQKGAGFDGQAVLEIFKNAGVAD